MRLSDHHFPLILNVQFEQVSRIKCAMITRRISTHLQIMNLLSSERDIIRELIVRDSLSIDQHARFFVDNLGQRL